MSRRTILPLVSGLVVPAFVGLISLTSLADRFENEYALGLLYNLRGPIEPPPGAIIAAIDGKTLDWLSRDLEPSQRSLLIDCLPPNAVDELSTIRGPGTLPRSIHACLLEELMRLGFPVVAFDILFAARGNRQDDLKFASALRNHGASALLVGVKRSVVQDGPSEILTEQEVKPLDLFEYSAASTGAFVVPRSGGPVYGYWPHLKGFTTTKSLPVEALRLRNSSIERSADDYVPEGKIEYLWMYGAPGTIQTISLHDILDGTVSDEVKSRASTTVVFVGASDPSATNFVDSFPSFFRGASDSDISGVELAATAYLNLAHAEKLQRPSTFHTTVMLIAVSFALGVFARANPKHAMILTPLFAAMYLAIATFAFTSHRLLIPLGVPLIVLLPVTFILAAVTRYRFVRALISRLASAPVAYRMLSKSSEAPTTAVSDEATVMFVDLIGSSLIAESIPPIEYGKILNSFHGIVARVVDSHHGFVAAFMGDGAMIVFTAKDAGTKHAVYACEAALAIVMDVRALNSENAKCGGPSLGMRFGMNTGLVAEGDIGGAERFNFSVVGDVVNLAARLEQLGKTLFPGQTEVILVGQSTRSLVDSKIMSFVDCGQREIPGRIQQEVIYRLSAP